MKRTLMLLLSIVAGQQVGSDKPLSCKESKIEQVNFVCGEIPNITPYQPCDGFELTYGKATSATVLWLLGDDHNESKNAVRCIDQLTKNVSEHTIYFEGIQAGKETSCQSYWVPNKPGRVCKGWDNEIAHKKFGELIPPKKEIEFNTLIRMHLHSLEERYIRDKSDREFDRTIHYLKKIFNDESDDNAFKKPYIERGYVPSMIAAIDWVLSQKKEGKSYMEAFNSFKTHPTEDYTFPKKDVIEALELTETRHQDLLSTIRKHPTGRIGIWVAGYEHLENPSQKGTTKPTSPTVKEMRRQLDKFADTNPFAILRSKSARP